MTDIKPGQHWKDGFEEFEVIKIFGVRIEIANVTSHKVEHLIEDEFRKRFTYYFG